MNAQDLFLGNHKLGERVLVMGIVNVSPDSFSDGKLLKTTKEAIDHAERLVAEGADIVDIGGVATSPHCDPAKLISPAKELDRVLPVVEGLAARGISTISVDTMRADVAEQCLKAGALWINDQSAASFDRKMPSVMARASGVVIMHRQGQQSGVLAGDAVKYNDVISEIRAFFEERLEFLTLAGVNKAKVVIDPGIGFGKGLRDSISIINNMYRFLNLGAATMLGVSRKSFLHALYPKEDPSERDYMTLGAHAAAILSGVSILRTHNVRATVEMTRIFERCLVERQKGAHPG